MEETHSFDYLFVPHFINRSDLSILNKLTLSPVPPPIHGNLVCEVEDPQSSFRLLNKNKMSPYDVLTLYLSLNSGLFYQTKYRRSNNANKTMR